MERRALLENLRLSAACGADPAMLISVALAGARPSSLVEAFDWLSRQRRDIESLAARPAGLRTLASLEPLGLTRKTKHPPPPRGGEGRSLRIGCPRRGPRSHLTCG